MGLCGLGGRVPVPLWALTAREVTRTSGVLCVADGQLPQGPRAAGREVPGLPAAAPHAPFVKVVFLIKRGG